MNLGKHSTVTFLVLLLAVSLLLRIPGLLESLWYDEVYRTQLMLQKKSLSKLLFHDVHNFLYNVMMYLWINVFGDSELSIRIPSLLLGYASAIIFSLWVSRKFGASIALAVLAWVLLSPFHIWYSTEAKNNAVVILFATLIFVSYANLLEDGQWKWVVLATVSGVLGILTDFLLLLPLLSMLIMIVADLARNFSKDALKKVITVFILTACLASPLIIFKLGLQDEMLRTYLKPLNVEELYLLLFNFLSNGNAILKIHVYKGLASVHGLGCWIFLLVSSLVLIIVFLRGAYAFMKSRTGLFVNIAFTVPIVTMFCLTWYASARYGEKHFVYLERNLGSILLYLYALILIYGVSQIGKLKLRHGILATIFALNLVGTGLMLTVNKDQWTVWLPNPDWRTFANDVRDDMREALVFTNCKPLAIRYYLKDLESRATEMKIAPNVSARNLRAYISGEFQSRLIQHPRCFYIAINKFWDTAPTRVLNYRLIRRMYHLVERKDYKALEVYKYSLYPL
jgi:uncharacterized membrane protein